MNFRKCIPWIIAILLIVGIIVVVIYCRNDKNSKENISLLDNGSGFNFPLNPGPPLRIPRISVPSCLGLLMEYQMEWWFYVGHVVNKRGRKYTIQTNVIRYTLPDFLGYISATTATVNIGDQALSKYIANRSYGLGVAEQCGGSLVVPKVTDDKFSLEYESFDKTQTMTAEYIADGSTSTVAAVGALYNFQAKDTKTGNAVSLNLQDMSGMWMEGVNGYVGPLLPDQKPPGTDTSNFQGYSLEYCMPYLKVLDGQISFNGQTSSVKEGSFWLDRHAVTYPKGEGPLGQILKAIFGGGGQGNLQNILSDRDKGRRFTQALSKIANHSHGFQLYRGNWLGGVFHDGTPFYMAFFWPQVDEPGKQWMVGTKVGIPPIKMFGHVYRKNEEYMNYFDQFKPAMSTLVGKGNNSNTQLNIMAPYNNSSPHWRSPKSGNIYCSAWELNFGKGVWLPPRIPRTIYIRYIVPNCENYGGKIGSSFCAGQAEMFADTHYTQLIGHVWVEQMGQN